MHAIRFGCLDSCNTPICKIETKYGKLGYVGWNFHQMIVNLKTLEVLNQTFLSTKYSILIEGNIAFFICQDLYPNFAQTLIQET